LITGTGTAGQLNGEANLQFNGSTLSVTGDTNITGSLTAASKSFLVPHPTKEGWMLRYVSLEGPENGVYLRGRLTDSSVINLPEHWLGLVHENSISVHLTPIGEPTLHFVREISGNNVYVGVEEGKSIDCFYTVNAERKDIPALVVEYPITS
jgi:hypothetical protein